MVASTGRSVRSIPVYDRLDQHTDRPGRHRDQLGADVILNIPTACHDSLCNLDIARTLSVVGDVWSVLMFESMTYVLRNVPHGQTVSVMGCKLGGDKDS